MEDVFIVNWKLGIEEEAVYLGEKSLLKIFNKELT